MKQLLIVCGLIVFLPFAMILWNAIADKIQHIQQSKVFGKKK